VNSVIVFLLDKSRRDRGRAALLTGQAVRCLLIASVLVSAEYVKVRPPFDSGPSNQNGGSGPPSAPATP
jgi:hypothetical protein